MWLSHHFRMRGQAERKKTLVHLFHIVNIVCLLGPAGYAELLILCVASERLQLILRLRLHNKHKTHVVQPTNRARAA